MNPLVSVIMSVYNGETYLEEAVSSILNQTFGDFEFIIIDDGSTDATPEILQRFAVADSRVRVITQPNAGLTISLNRGLRLARGDLLARQDADDLAMPERFERQVAVMQANSEVVLCNTYLRFIDGNGETTHDLKRSPEHIGWYLHCFNHLAGHSQVMFRRAAVEAVDGYNESIPDAQDYDLWLRLWERGEIQTICEILQSYRVHQGNVTAAQGERQLASGISIQRAFLERRYGLRFSKKLLRLLRYFWNECPYRPEIDWEKDLPQVCAALRRLLRAYLTKFRGAKRARVARELRLLIVNRIWEVLSIQERWNERHASKWSQMRIAGASFSFGLLRTLKILKYVLFLRPPMAQKSTSDLPSENR